MSRRWSSEADPSKYFCGLDGHVLRDDELYFETRPQSPLPDMVYRGGIVNLRTRFYDLGDSLQHEILVER